MACKSMHACTYYVCMCVTLRVRNSLPTPCASSCPLRNLIMHTKMSNGRGSFSHRFYTRIESCPRPGVSWRWCCRCRCRCCFCSCGRRIFHASVRTIGCGEREMVRGNAYAAASFKWPKPGCVADFDRQSAGRQRRQQPRWRNALSASLTLPLSLTL